MLLAAAALVAGITGIAQAQLACRAIDGDTLRCGAERVRVIGLYAPEIGEPGGFSAKARLQQRLEQGAVTLERRARDRYGRTLARIYVNGELVTQADIGARGGRGLKRITKP